MNGREFRQVKNLVDAVAGDPVVKRVRIFADGGTTINGSATNGGVTNVKLLKCDADNNPDEDLATDGTNLAEISPGSRITSIDLMLFVKGNSVPQLEVFMFRDPDNILGGSTLNPTKLFQQDVDTTTVILRKNCLTYFPIIPTTTHDLWANPVRISAAALARNRRLKAGDDLNLNFYNANSSATGKYWLVGKINCRSL